MNYQNHVMKKLTACLLITVSALTYSCNGNANGTARTDSASPSIKDTTPAVTTDSSGGKTMDSTKTDSSAHK